MEKPEVKKLSRNNLKCAECGGKLAKTTKAELKKLNVFLKPVYGFSRGLWQCGDCGELSTMTITSSDPELAVWREEIQGLSENDLISQDEIVSAVMGAAMIVSGKIEAEMVSISEALRCEGQGPGCRHYWLAACGMGFKEICGSRNCRYDPYSPDWYRKLVHENLLGRGSRPLPDMICYWHQELEKSQRTKNMDAQSDALRRLGLFARISKVKYWLIACAKDQHLDGQLREIAINALSNLRCPEELADLKDPFLKLLAEDGENIEIKKAVILAIRKMRFTDIELIEQIALSSGRKALEKDARVTLRILEQAMKVKKRK